MSVWSGEVSVHVCWIKLIQPTNSYSGLILLFKFIGHPDPLFHPSQGSTEHWKVAREVFGRRLKELRASVPNQTKDTWLKISASLKSPLSPSPSYPGVLLLYSPQPDSPTSTCLAGKLLSMSSEALKGAAPSLPMAQLLTAPSSLPKDPHQAKEALYSHLHNVISNTGVAGMLSLTYSSNWNT